MVLDKILAYCVLSKKKKFSNRYTVRGFTPNTAYQGDTCRPGEISGTSGSTRVYQGVFRVCMGCRARAGPSEIR
jgi:hypothetical protein